MEDPTTASAMAELINQGVLGIALAISLAANVWLLRLLLKSFDARINDANAR
jgi:hypothetical protein